MVFFLMRGKGNESSGFVRLHNFPCEVWTSVITSGSAAYSNDLWLGLAGVGIPLGDTVSLIHHHARAIAQKEQQMQPLCLVFEPEGAWAFNQINLKLNLIAF